MQIVIISLDNIKISGIIKIHFSQELEKMITYKLEYVLRGQQIMETFLTREAAEKRAAELRLDGVYGVISVYEEV